MAGFVIKIIGDWFSYKIWFFLKKRLDSFFFLAGMTKLKKKGLWRFLQDQEKKWMDIRK